MRTTMNNFKAETVDLEELIKGSVTIGGTKIHIYSHVFDNAVVTQFEDKCFKELPFPYTSGKIEPFMKTRPVQSAQTNPYITWPSAKLDQDAYKSFRNLVMMNAATIYLCTVDLNRIVSHISIPDSPELFACIARLFIIMSTTDSFTESDSESLHNFCEDCRNFFVTNRDRFTEFAKAISYLNFELRYWDFVHNPQCNPIESKRFDELVKKFIRLSGKEQPKPDDMVNCTPLL